MEQEIRRSIILDHYQNPYHRVRHDGDSEYHKVNSRNVSCIDNIDLYIKMDGDIIKEICFDGEACSISISSTSIMGELLEGHTIDEALEIIQNYDNMIEEKSYDESLLKDAVVYEGVAKQPSRKTCATLSWNGLRRKLLELKEEKY